MSKPKKIMKANVKQPKLSLPRSIGDRRIAEHPLMLARRRVSRTDLAVAMGVTPQALIEWERRCTDNRDYALPPARVKHIALAAEVPPYALRPDVFEQGWNYSADVVASLSDFFSKFVTPTRGKLAGGR